MQEGYDDFTDSGLRLSTDPVARTGRAAGLPECARARSCDPIHTDRESIAHDLPLEALGQHAMTTPDGAPWVLGADVCRGSWAGIMWDGITIKGLFASTI